MAVQQQSATKAVENELEELCHRPVIRSVRLFQPVAELPVGDGPPP